MAKQDEIQKLLDKVEKVTEKHELDLSSGEDLSVGVMNLIGIEEHLFFTYGKTKNKQYLDLLDEIRQMRIELMKKIIKDYEGEEWCVSKHLLAASMRLMEVGTKELKKGKKEEAWDLFEKAYHLYSLFWGINLKVVKMDEIEGEKVHFIDEKGKQKDSESVFSKLNTLLQKALNCCRE